MHPDVAALLAVQDDDLDDSRARDAARRAAAAARRDGEGARQGARRSSQQARKTADVGGAPPTRRRGARRAAPRAAGEESDGAQQRDVDARGDGGDGAARAGQANDRRGRARARRRSVSGSPPKRIAGRRPRARSPPSSRPRRRQARDSLVGRSAAHRGTSSPRRAQEREEKAHDRAAQRCSSTYDRIRSRKRVHAVFPLRGKSCGNCDTMIPMQRRSIMSATGAHGDLRRMWSDAVRGGLMIVGRCARPIAFRRDHASPCALARGPLAPARPSRIRASSSGFSEELHLPRAICRLLAVRGFGAPDDAKTYLRPRLDQLHEPNCSPISIERSSGSCARSARARRFSSTATTTSTASARPRCMVRTLARARRQRRSVHSAAPRGRLRPHRRGRARGASARARRVVVTCDCGTSAHRTRSPTLQAAGIDVIVTDHHLPGGPLPPAYAVLNPKRPGCPSPDKDLAAVGVAFKLALALTRALGGNENVVFGMLDLVALATIADVAPLRGENRVLRALRSQAAQRDRSDPGIRAMIRAAGLEGKALTAGRIGFILAPRLNAAGRLGQRAARRRAADVARASRRPIRSRASSRSSTRAGRRSIARRSSRRASACSRWISPSTYGIVLAEQGWHPGVIGIVASRIVEEFGRPTVLIALEGDEGKGSGRSISAFDLHGGLRSAAICCMRFGGHRMRRGRDDRRATALREFARASTRSRASRAHARTISFPSCASISRCRSIRSNDELETLLRHLEPCGIGNPSPLFVTRGVTVAAPPRVVGKDGLKLVLADGERRELDALGWGMGPRIARARRRRDDRRRVSPRARRVERRVAPAGAARRLPRLSDAHRRRTVARATHRRAEGRPRAADRRSRSRSVDEHRQPVAPRCARARPLRRLRRARPRSAVARRRRRGSRRDRAEEPRAIRATPTRSAPATRRVIHRADALRFVDEAGRRTHTTSPSPIRRTTSGLATRSPSGGSHVPFADILGIEHRRERDAARRRRPPAVRRHGDHASYGRA